MLGFIKLRINLILLANCGMGIFCIVRIAKDRKCVLRFLFNFLAKCNLRLPQIIYNTGKSAKCYEFVGTIRSCEFLVPVLHFPNIIPFQFHDNLIGITAHAWITQQEVINLAKSGFLFPFCSQRYTFRGIFIPTQALGGCGQCRLGVYLSPCTDQRVAVYQLRIEPRYKAALIDGIQPQGNFSQLHSDRVQVHTVDIAVGDVHFNLLQLVKTILIADDFSCFLLFFGDICFRKLIDGLV